MKTIFKDFGALIVYVILSFFIPQYLALSAAIMTFFLSGGVKKLNDKMLIDWITIIALCVFLVLSLLHRGVMDKYQWTLLSFCFTTMAWGSIIIRQPFTLQYSKKMVPEQYWTTPIFLHINYFLTTVWAVAFTISFVIHLLPWPGSLIKTIISIALITTATIITEKYPSYYKNKKLKPETSH